MRRQSRRDLFDQGVCRLGCREGRGIFCLRREGWRRGRRSTRLGGGLDVNTVLGGLSREPRLGHRERGEFAFDLGKD